MSVSFHNAIGIVYVEKSKGEPLEIWNDRVKTLNPNMLISYVVIM